MRIGIDVSQLAYSNTGVANFLKNFIDSLVTLDKENDYIFFFSSLRGTISPGILKHQSNPKISIKTFKIPPTVLDFLWNKVHIRPIESFIGPVDIFITSDWTEPPVRSARKATIIYDLIVYKYPQETHSKIIATQKRKLRWVKKESDLVFTISESSKKDIEEVLGIPSNKINVIYPGI